LAGAQKVDIVPLRKLVQKERHANIVSHLLVHFISKNMLHIVEVFGWLTRLSMLESDIIFANLPNLLKERLGVSVCLNIGQTSILRSQSYIDLDVEKDGRRIVW
jgi:hypothetical protein